MTKIYTIVAYCMVCGKITKQRITDSEHERDGSGDQQHCMECHHVYSGLTGKWSESPCSHIPAETIDESQVLISDIQQALVNRGYQFIEHIFNDGAPNNCFVQITKNKNPRFFNSDTVKADEVQMWGRYPRAEAWQMINSDLNLIKIKEE